MGFYPKKQKSSVDLTGTTYINGTALTASAAELNLNDTQTATAAEVNALAGQGAVAADIAKLHALTVTAAEVNTLDLDAVQTVIADGAITIKNGVVILAKTGGGALAVTLADPAAGDNYKKLYIFNGDASASTVTSAGGFGGAGAGEDVATFTGTLADSLTLMAYATKWHIVGGHQVATA